MELISKEKSRNITFKKRKEGLIRKMHEFTTLCDVSACMIIYGPKQDKGGSNDPEIWPQDLDEVRRIIDIYKSKNRDSGNKTFGLSDFFHDRKRKIEDELAKLRKKNMEAKYPTWLEFMNSRTEPQFRQFAAALSNKAEYVNSRIEFLKRSSKEGFSDMNVNMNMNNMNNINMLDFAHRG
ncbi:UNVERIFIED_CONTAM: Agamous-like MADS-box protein [Sesamum radiatum]|uniref:Agamous-like MADS-box protein n=1 Tax=Sesamum radiatum TaxID=300843 RepID=A0AAW2MX50_SESRA